MVIGRKVVGRTKLFHRTMANFHAYKWCPISPINFACESQLVPISHRAGRHIVWFYELKASVFAKWRSTRQGIRPPPSAIASCGTQMTSESFPNPRLQFVSEDRPDKYRRSGATINSPSLCIPLSLSLGLCGGTGGRISLEILRGIGNMSWGNFTNPPQTPKSQNAQTQGSWKQDFQQTWNPGNQKREIRISAEPRISKTGKSTKT